MSKKYIVIIIATLVAAVIFVCISVALSGSTELPSTDTGADKNATQPFCLLVLGKDKVSALTDVMMLISFDIKNDRICVMQLPRDTYVDYGNASHKKLNTAVKFLGGEEKLCDFLSSSFGVHIDGYVSLELDAFRKIIDTIGGVEIELPDRFDYEDPEQNLYIHLPAGKQVLDGKKAEMVVRFRSGYVRGDLDRLDMQKRFLVALFNKLKTSVTPSNAYELASNIIEDIDTNIDLALAIALGLEALSVDNSSIGFLTLPGEDVISDRSGASYYVMCAAAARSVLVDCFFADGDRLDEKKQFRHPSNKKFSDIYDNAIEPEVVFADTLN